MTENAPAQKQGIESGGDACTVENCPCPHHQTSAARSEGQEAAGVQGQKQDGVKYLSLSLIVLAAIVTVLLLWVGRKFFLGAGLGLAVILMVVAWVKAGDGPKDSDFRWSLFFSFLGIALTVGGAWFEG